VVNLVVCTHGKFSEELVRASEMMFGKQDNLQCITFEPGESVDGLVEKYENSIRNFDDQEEILFLVDLFGGSPYNAACRIAAGNERMDVVTGVNLPMLLETYVSRSVASLPELVNAAINAGRNSANSFKSNFDNNVEEEL